MTPVTESILKQSMEGTKLTVCDGAERILRWYTNKLHSDLKSIGLSKKDIIQTHKSMHGKDGYVLGHCEIIGDRLAKETESYTMQVIGEVHDLAESFLILDGRMADYPSGYKPNKAKIDELFRLRMILTNSEIKPPLSVDQCLQIIQKEGYWGQILKETEIKQFKSHASYMTQKSLRLARKDGLINECYAQHFSEMAKEVKQNLKY
jgi:hypothetical protein